MHNNDSDVDRIQKAILDLRAEEVPQEAKARAFAKMLSPRKKQVVVPAFAAAVTSAITLAILLWPQSKAMAWSQVVQSTLSSRRLHRISYEQDRQTGSWKRTTDEWIDGDRWSLTGRVLVTDQSPGVQLDMRFDGQRTYRRDWTGFGVVYKTAKSRPTLDTTQRFTIEGLLSDKRLKIDPKPTETSVNGVQVLRYSAKAIEGPVHLGFTTPMAFYVEKSNGRVIKTELFGRFDKLTSYSSIEYPPSISSTVFEPPKDGPETFDLDRDARLIMNSMSHGINIGNGNVLRAAILSPSGELLVLWTGTPPNGDGSPGPALADHSSKFAYAPDQLTVSRWKVNPKSIYLFESQVLSGVALVLKKPISSTIDLEMPILAIDRLHPIRNGQGEVKAYRSKRIGTKRIKDYPVIRTMPFATLAIMKQTYQW